MAGWGVGGTSASAEFERRGNGDLFLSQAARTTPPTPTDPNQPTKNPNQPNPTNRRSVIEINLLSDPSHLVDISEGADGPPAEFTYSVKWTQTHIKYEDRLQRYERFPLNPVHLEVRGWLLSLLGGGAAGVGLGWFWGWVVISNQQ
jgi:hypothetical protein